MKELGYGSGYRYAHDEPGGIADQQHLPDELAGTRFYEPTAHGHEAEIGRRMKAWEALLARRAGERRPEGGGDPGAGHGPVDAPGEGH